MDAVGAAFAGTGFNLGAGSPPAALQVLVACMNSPIKTPSFP